MEDRYEIRGKIGQGGLGAVYKAFDIRMNREVAIKRIIANTDDADLPAEATRQLIQEAGSLAALQHPNIVTIYDVGEDEDGPFVVMELLSGDTLEETIGKGSFTWADFRELATQILEALIAAQELHIVHRDLKPSNIMLTWLPSGKFQVKIVDFGLAKLSAAPSLQTVDQSDGVFGSIYFMAPEQFERKPIDHKTDLYAVGCVFYYALTGFYPFDGESAAEVMASHLQHFTVPIQEVRDGIPLWACDWIMWHINRQASDRPESARQALQYFLENEAALPDPPVSSGTPTPEPELPKRRQLNIPGGAPKPEVIPDPSPTQRVKTAAEPKPLLPPEGSKPSVHTKTQRVQAETPKTESTPPAQSNHETSSDANEPEIENNSPAAEKPESPAKPIALGKTKPKLAVADKATALVLPTAKLGSPKPVEPKSTALEASPMVEDTKTPPQKKQRAISTNQKLGLVGVLSLLILCLGYFLLQKSKDNATTKLYNEMILEAAKPEATEVPVNKEKLEILLRSASSVGSNTDRAVIYKALFLAKATDNTNVDARIAEHATTGVIIPDVRTVLIRDVLRQRNNPEIIDTLLSFSRETENKEAAKAAIEATRLMATDTHFSQFLEIIQTTQSDPIRKAAEINAAEIVKKSANKPALGRTLKAAYQAAFNDTIRHTMLRLVGRVGGKDALAIAQENLESPKNENKIAAIVALSTWANDGGYKKLIEYLASSPEINLRNRAYRSAFQYVKDSENNAQENWTLLSQQTKTEEEQLTFIRGLANVDPAPWSYQLLQKIADSSESDRAIDLAIRAIARLKDIEKTTKTSR